MPSSAPLLSTCIPWIRPDTCGACMCRACAQCPTFSPAGRSRTRTHGCFTSWGGVSCMLEIVPGRETVCLLRCCPADSRGGRRALEDHGGREMDERHWWIAGKVQQALDNGTEESSAALEAFILEDANLQLINRFLQAGGHQAIFFLVETSDKTNPLTWKFHLKTDLQKLESVHIKTSFPTLLYFLRFEISHDVDVGLMEKEIFCGEIKENPVESLRCLLNELYIPLLRAQKDWGFCSQENVAGFLSGLEKYVSSIDEAATIPDLEKQHITILKRPQNIVSPDFLLQRSVVLDPEIVSENETLISEWIKTIDQVLIEAIDERVLDITTTPLTELERWHHRQKMLSLITEQLRGKECKSVLGIMISSKSRLLKRWKAVDISITEALNATKDCVKYLEALYRHFDALSTDYNPENIINSILPGFFNSIQQMEMLTRHFSKNGYLGLLLTKVSNQLALNCKSFLKEIISVKDSKDRLWEILREHITKDKKEVVSVSGFGEERIPKKEKFKVKVLKSASNFYERIQACLAVYTCFQEEVQRLREWLLGSHGLQRYSSLSSVSTAPGRLSSLQTSKTNKTNMKVTLSVQSSSDQQHDYQSCGVVITDDDTIMYHLEALSIKLKQMLDIADKLQEYNILSKMTEGLRKPAQEDLMEDEDFESESVFDIAMQEDAKETDVQTEPSSYQPQILRQITSTPGKLQTLIEEDEPQMFVEDSSMLNVPSVKCEDSSTKAVSDLKNDQLTPNTEEDKETGLSNEEKRMLANLYNREDVDDDECTLSSVLLEKLEQMIEVLTQYIDADILLDTERRHRDPFEEGYSEFLVMNQQAEKYISVYIQALFLRQMPCKDALSIIQRFSIVSHRQGIQHIISECYVEVFDWFYLELKDIQQVYETYKDEPVLPRNMPPAVGAIVWSRKLMSRIENTMKAFKNVRIVATCLTYSDTVRLYNRIASALVSYEDMWFQKWKSQIDKGLNGLHFTLLTRDPVSQQLMVNTDMRILQLIEETKWMLRLGIRVPETALLAFHQAEKFKMYRSNLEGVVKEYGRIQQEIPENFAVLFSPHLEQVNHQFQPGLSTLSWSSVNIEGLLHQSSAAVKRLQSIVAQVTEIKEMVIEKTLEEISYFDIIPMDECTSAPKTPDEFLQLMQISLMEKKTKVETMACLIKKGFEDILKILKKFQNSIPENSRPSGHLRNTSSKSLTQKSSHKSQIMSRDDSSKEYPEEVTRRVLESISHQLYQAVYTCILRSLVILAQLAGCEVEHIARGFSHVLNKAPDGPNSQQNKPLVNEHMFKEMLFRSRIQAQKLRFRLSLKFQIPHILIDPSTEVAEDALHQVVLSIIDLSSYLNWWSGEKKGQPFHVNMATDKLLQYITTKVVESVRDVNPVVKKHVFTLSCYDFLWADNMYRQSEEFLTSNPSLDTVHKEVKRFLKIEEQIKEYPEVFPLGCICLDYSLIKETLKGFVGSWKCHYANILHQCVKEELLHVVQYRVKAWQQLTMPVESLEQLNSILALLEELQNMENKIDEVYQPIELTYEQLRSYQLRIPREEVNDVTNLRNKWDELMDLTSVVKDNLLKEKQDIFKQELDKQVKSFVVEVIQFRNRFDTQGPAAPGVKPEEAVTRLHDFNEKYQAYDAKRKTLISVQKLFNIVPKKFYELDRTGKDLELLGTLYILFQKFIEFDQRFRNTLWADVDLGLNNQEVEQYFSECQIWSDKLKDWDAYNKMAQDIKFYEDVFPILHEFKSKEIRNRHWLQVMSVTGSSFPLEANVFKVFHLLDIGLLKFKKQLMSIAKAAKKEMELEIKMRKVEEEWSEQILSFRPYKNKVLLVKDESLILLEELEDAQVLIGQMLTSKEIDPLREEATTWAEKLKRVGDVLELWIDVQELWLHLEEVYSNPTISQELPRDARRFAKVNRRWTLMMISAYKTKNVLQCCCTGDVPKEVLLRHFYLELEICFSALNSYLGRMRQTFPRFYFLSDLALMSVLSQPYDIRHLQHHLRCLFSGVSSIEVENVEEEESVISDEEEVEATGPVLDFLSVRSGNEGWLSTGQRSTTHVTDTESLFQRSLKSAGISQNRNRAIAYKEPSVKLNAVSVTDFAGECLQLDEQVAIASDVGAWLSKLHSSLRASLNNKIYNVIGDINQGMAIDEWTQKYPTQAAVLGLLYLWTKDFESSISEIRQDRKAQSRILKKYTAMAIKLSAITAKGHWKNMEDSISQSQRLKLENIIMQVLYLRDVMENILSRKLRETADFDWRRTMKFYLKEKDGSSRHELSILDAKYTYGCEFYGAKIPVIMNPVTEKCFFKISQILQQCNGVILQGDHGVGKTETIKGLAYLLGNFIYNFTCSSVTDIAALSRVIDGTALDGCWSCFDDFHLLPENAVSVFMHSTRSLYDSIQAKLPKIVIEDGSQIEVQSRCSVFLTVSKSGFHSLPKDILAVFRAVSLVLPDHTIILKAKLTSLGFKGPKALATRLQLTSELLKEQLPEESHCHFSLRAMLEVINWAVQRREMENMINGRMESDGGRFSRSSSVMSYQQFTAFAASPVPSLKTGNSAERNKKVISTNPVLTAAKESHALIADSLQDIIGPRMTGDSYLVFKQIVGDVFTGMYDPSETRQILQKEIERAILLKSEENKLFPHSPWLSKVKQLFNLSLVNSGVIVAGPPASGKSSCISILIQALNHIQVSSGEASHKIVKIHPLSVDNRTLMFGGLNASNMWQDGVISYSWKKAVRNHCNTWLWFDGALNGSWADNFNSVLGPETVLQLINGDYLELPENLKLIFETTGLQKASPATLTKAVILYIENEAVGWRPLSKIWLDGRNQQENAVLSKAFYRTLDPIFNLMLHDTKLIVPVTEVGLFHSVTSLLAIMLNDKAQSIGGQLHIERLFIFCLIWSVGSLIECAERKKFSDLLKVYTSVLPDDEQEISVFDYFLDESGEWDTWQSRLPDITYVGNTDIMGEIFIETQDTVIVRTFLEYASMGSQHVLLTGPAGCGKTALMNDFDSTQDRTRTLLKRMVFSGSSKAKELQELLEQNVVHRQGFIYGAKDGKTLQLFIDDLHLPTPDENGVQHCNELLRMLLDDKTLVRFNKSFEWQTIEGLLVKAVMGQPKYINSAHRVSAQRLLRHFSIFHLPNLEGSQLQKVIFSILEANMGEKDGLSLQEDFQLSLAKASCHILESVRNILVNSSTPGRQHYLFSLGEITKVFQSLRKLSNEDREDRGTVVGYWEHEINCVIRDRLCRHADISWFKSELTTAIKEYFPDITSSALQKIYTTFPLEMKSSYQTRTNNKDVKILLQSLEKLDDVQTFLETIVQHYNEELGHQKLHIELSENVVIQVIRIHRVLCSENSGNALLVGCVGSHLSTLVKLALYVADIPLHPLDISGSNAFLNSLKSAIQISAVEGKSTAILCTGEELATEGCLNAINSLLICGEYSPLFTTEEMNDLLQVLGPALRRKHPHLGCDPTKYFISQVKSYLRIIVCISPYHELLKTASGKYPGFLTGCQLIWIDSWSQDVINREAKHYIMQPRIMEAHTEETRGNVATVITLIHSYMLHQNDQVPWTGNSNASIFFKGADEVGQSNCSLRDVGPAQHPYCKDITQEKLRLLLSKEAPMTDKVFIGPSTLQMFLDNFKHIFLKKAEEQHKTNNQLKHVLETLTNTRMDAKKTQESIGGLEEKYKKAQIMVSDILDKLITKTSMLEQLKAVLGIGDETLQIFLSQNENELDNFDENDDLLKDDGCDEYDEAFYRMKEASKKSYLHDIQKKIEKAADELEELKKHQRSIKNEVMHWCSKVDKPCVERLVRCQNPPYLVAQILEMALVMISCLCTAENINDLQKSPQPSPVSKSTPSKKGMRDPTDKVDRARWKKIQYQIGETSKFVDMIHQIAKLEDGLPEQTLKDVEAYLGKAKEGSHGVTGEGSLLENAAPYATPQSITPAKKYSHIDYNKNKGAKGGGITIATARYSSEDAASLVAFVVAIVEYTRLCAPLKECQKKLSNLEKEKEDLILKEAQSRVMPESFEEEPVVLRHQTLSALTADDLPPLQIEVTKLHEEYDAAVSHKHQLEEELQSHKEKLQAAVNTLDRLKIQEQEWREHLKQSNISDLLTNCLLAAAFITYCPALSVEGRRRVTDLLYKVCESCDLPLPQRTLLKDLPLIQFMQSPIEIKTLEKRGLPTNPLALNNSCIFSNTTASNSWVLVSDPTGQAINWIKGHLPEDTVETMYNTLLSEMDTCLTVGQSLLLTYCEIQDLSRDIRLGQILRSKREFMQHILPFKMMVGEHEVECHPSFRLFLHTTKMPQEVPPEVASFCTILYFYQDREGLVEQLLDRFVELEKPRLKEEHLQLKQECLNNMVTLSALKEKIIATLQTHDSLLHSLSVTKKLGDLTLQHEEATEMYMKTVASEDSLLLTRGGFREIAVRGAVMFDTARMLQELNRMYDTSYRQLLQLFDVSVAHSERYSLKGIVACVTSNIFSYISRSLLEKDRMVYALIVAFEVEESLGRIRAGEREFIMSPELRVTVLQRMNSKMSESRQQAKNPFDWMSEEQFKNVQILAIYFDWFGDLFDRMYKDSKDLTWKTFCESEQPENPSKVKWPEGIEALSPLQKCMVLRAVRMDRILPSASNYIGAALGKMYASDVATDLQTTLSWMSPHEPGLLIYGADCMLPRTLLEDLAETKNQKMTILPIGFSEDKTKNILIQAMSEGSWMLIENIHNSAKLMMSFGEILKSNKNPDKNFRLWLSVQARQDLPTPLLHYTVRTIVDTPMNIRRGIIYSWKLVNQETLVSSSRPEWPALLHNLCFLHCAIRIRTLYGALAGWNCPDAMRFGWAELTESIEVLKREFKDDLQNVGKLPSWTAVRYLLSEVIYGRNVADEFDMTVLTSMTDYWISPNTMKKDSELTKLKFRIPSPFFNPDLNPVLLTQALESIPQYSLDSPEAFHVHPSPMVPFGEQGYVISKLGQLYGFKQEPWRYGVKSLPTSQKGVKPVTFASPRSLSLTLPEILPSSADIYIPKLSEVQDICASILSKLPRGWSRDFINDRLKKLGGDTPFNLFFKKELSNLMSLVSEVRNNLQMIRNSLESSDILGDQLSDPDIITIVHDLYHKKPPAHWCNRAWNSSCPSDCSVSYFIQDLQQRVTHFEKLLQFGREKMPIYWLGAFRNPKGLLSVLKQEAIRRYSERTGNVDSIDFKTEITQRDKEHIRDPPQEGIFVHGVHLWGVHWNKTDGEIVDSPPKHSLNILPVIHLQCLPTSEKSGIHDTQKSDTYLCPVYLSSTSRREPVFTLDIHKENIASSRWALRGMKATIHPF
ncbi:dynein axonemal heavy chain 5-like isoform X2 [Bufo gargarizans]|uniref:dynein axonemal heavy chain 5-like isoform X2 n=1 Tax=Bufo gargarizans TaxID=30331 RepID=UPI001CF480D9|nr:dynein axonemal heavy chain 5-like isoform X2 [Bufo gargarizans]